MPVAIEIIVFVGVLAVVRLFFGRKKDGNKEKSKGPQPPSFPSFPFIGSLPYLRGLNNAPEFLQKSAKQLGPIFTFTVMSKKILVLNSKDAIEEAYVNHLSTFSGRASMYHETIVNPRRKGISSQITGRESKRFQQLHLSILKEFGFGMKNQMENRILTEVEAMVDYVRKINGQTFTPREAIAMIVTNVINNIVFGHRRDYKQGIGEVYRQSERYMLGLNLTFELCSAIRFIPRYRDQLNVIRNMHTVVIDLIAQEVERCKSPEADDCFVKRYLEKEGSNYDEEQLLITLRDLVMAGSDTTMNTLLWSLVALADHPAAQDRLRLEIDAVVPRDRFPELDDRSRLPYVEATILEFMRWKTLVPLSLPRMTLNDVRIGGYFVPAGTTVLANLYAAHMDAKDWGDPTEFRPERFLDSDNNVIGKDRVIPFSLGRRSCLGEVLARTEIFLIFTAIVQNFVVLPPEGQEKVHAKTLDPVGFTMVPLPFNIRLLPRK